MEPLFPQLPENIVDLTDDELAQLHTDSLAVVEAIKAQDADVLGDRTAQTILAEMQAGVEAIETIAAEQTARAEAAQNFENEVAALAEKVTPAVVAEPAVEAVEEPAVEEPVVAEADEAVVEDVVVEEALPIAASARVFRRPPAPSRQHQPLAEKQGATIVASADISGVPAGSELDEHGLAEAMARVAGLAVAAPEGFSSKSVVASVRYPFPPERILDPRDSGIANGEKIKAVVGEQALVASGGLCAPRTPIYDLPVISVDDRPVRDALPSFQAARGGVSLPAPLGIADITTGVGRITEAQDAAGGSAATKACQTVVCPGYTTTDVAAIYHCMRFGNLGARAWPELIASFNQELFAAAARLADGALLDGISAGSTAVTGAQVNGAVNTLVGHILQAAAGIRSHERMRDGAILRAIFPAWIKDLLVLDIVRSQFQRFAYERDGIQALFRMFDIEASFTLDGETGGGQVFGAQSAGALLAFPTSLIWYLFPEGTWLHLDSGTLELGIVRDSTLNATNDFENFGETWENVAKVGKVSYKVTSTICPSGAVTAPGAAVAC